MFCLRLSDPELEAGEFAAVDDQAGSGDPLRSVRGEVGDGLGNVSRVSGADGGEIVEVERVQPFVVGDG